MKLREALEAGIKNPEVPQPIHAGRCEHKMLGGGYCGAPGRWWIRHEFRCSEHKEVYT